MPIPPGSRQVPGRPNRVQLDTGEVVTRARALNLGSQFMGYSSHREYRKNAAGDKRYADAWLRTAQGRDAMERERELARIEGRRFNKSQLTQRLIAARNARPHPRSTRPAGQFPRQQFTDFMSRYGITGGADWVAY
jgi:hypothetical protein